MNLIKVNPIGSLRWIGENFISISPELTVIGGNSIQEISNSMQIPAYSFGKFNPKNVFILFNKKLLYIYVNPQYKNYRSIARKIINIPNDYDIDHFLSKNIAQKANIQYVMIGVIPKSINRKHGNYERRSYNSMISSHSPNIFFCNNRIFNKVLNRNPNVRINAEELEKGYDLSSKHSSGLTLKQKGIWNFSLGLNLIDFENVLLKITPI